VSILGRIENLEQQHCEPPVHRRMIIKYGDETIEHARARQGAAPDEDVHILEVIFGPGPGDESERS